MKIIINNLVTEYDDQGQGPLVLMLHGWGNDLHSFDRLSERLKSKYRVVRLDLPGFGGTQRPARWILDDYIDFVISFLQKMNLEPEVLLGHSFGGRIIIKGVGQNKLRPRKIVMISPAGVSLFKSRRKLLGFLSKIGSLVLFVPPFLFWRQKIKKLFYKLIRSDYDESSPMKEIFGAVVGEDLTPFARAVSLPTLLVWGEFDQITPLSDGKLLHSLMTNSKLETIKEVGHFAHIEKSEEVVKLIEQFL